MRIFLSIVILFSSLFSHANEVEITPIEAPAPLEKTVEKVEVAASHTRDRRAKADYFALINYSPLDLLIPSKIGLSAGLIKAADKTWEFEYLNGSVAAPFFIRNLGSMNDTRYSLIIRSYSQRNSFNYSYGLTYFDFSTHLGDDLMSRVSGGNYPAMDLIKIQSLGFNVAFGNRWTIYKNVTFGVDWIAWSQPVFITTKEGSFLDHASNEQDRDHVNTAINAISFFPRFTLFKLQIGALF